MGLKSDFASFWDRITGKTLYELSRNMNQLEEKMSMLYLDLDAANIKLATSEIDREAKNVENEVLRMELEEKKEEIKNLNAKLATLKENLAKKSQATVSSDVKILADKLALEEYYKEEYKKRFDEIVRLLTLMSQDEKYNDIIKIQTNSIDENGLETKRTYMSYGETTVQVDGFDEIDVSAISKSDVTQTAEAVLPSEASMYIVDNYANAAVPTMTYDESFIDKLVEEINSQIKEVENEADDLVNAM